MMCLFIVADRCHVRHAVSLRKVSRAIFFSTQVLKMRIKVMEA